VLQKFGLLDYLQFDGYSYRLVPILTPYKDPWSIGRIDADYAYDKLMNTMRYGNLADERVYADYFTLYNLNVSRAREAFARVAREYIKQGSKEGLMRAEALLDRGLAVMPNGQIRFTEANTYPFIECYYDLGLTQKGDDLLKAFCNNLIEYLDYYMQFDENMGKWVDNIIYDKMDELERVYYLAAYHNREAIVQDINKYYRSLGAEDKDLILTQQEKDSLGIQGADQSRN
jgi:hypothetical protein